jgi:hypothetical protein
MMFFMVFSFTCTTGRFTVASVFAPVTMMPCPLLVYKQTIDEATGVVTRTDLVATGGWAWRRDY